MLGIKLRAFAPLCNLSLETLVPTDYFYRHLEAKLDLPFVRDQVAVGQTLFVRRSDAFAGPGAELLVLGEGACPIAEGGPR